MELDGEDSKHGSDSAGNSEDGWIQSAGAGSRQTAARTELGAEELGRVVALALLRAFMAAAERRDGRRP